MIFYQILQKFFKEVYGDQRRESVYECCGFNRDVSKISSCWVNTTSRQGIKQLRISFGFIFLLFSYERSQEPGSSLPGEIPAPWLFMTALFQGLSNKGFIKQTFWSGNMQFLQRSLTVIRFRTRGSTLFPKHTTVTLLWHSCLLFFNKWWDIFWITPMWFDVI